MHGNLMFKTIGWSDMYTNVIINFYHLAVRQW